MLLRRKKRRAGQATTADTLSLYYASDVHGSDVCWRKFLGAGRFYGVEALIMGGDLTGKAIVRSTQRARRLLLGDVHRRDAPGHDAQRSSRSCSTAIRFNGMYPWLAAADEIARARERCQAARGALFERVMLEELRRWIDLADERMAAVRDRRLRHAGQRRPVVLRRGARGGVARAGVRRAGRHRSARTR